MAKKKTDTEELDFEIEFYEKLLEKSPDEVTVLIPLGNVYTKKGLYKKGLCVDKRLVNLRPDEPIFFYNLACSFSLMGKKQEAVRALRDAFKLGYRDFEYIKIDTDLDNIRQDSQFKTLLRKHKSTAKD